MAKTLIMGIDPGYDRLGWAVGNCKAQNWTDVQFGCIQTKKAEQIFERYSQIQQELIAILQNHQPTHCAVESVFFAKNKKTALRVSEARGLIIGLLLQQNIKVIEITPIAAKQAVTGYGSADKSAVEKMIRLQLKLDKQPVIDDAMDALSLMITCQAQLNYDRISSR